MVSDVARPAPGPEILDFVAAAVLQALDVVDFHAPVLAAFRAGAAVNPERLFSDSSPFPRACLGMILAQVPTPISDPLCGKTG